MDSTNQLAQIETGQAQKEATANELFAAASPAMLFAMNATTTIGLTWGYYGGRFNSALISNGTVSLTASTTNYVVANRSTGAVTASTATTNWDNAAGYTRLYKVTTDADHATAWEDHRQTDAVAVSTIPLASKSADYTLVLADGGSAVLHPSADTTGRTFTIPANASVAYPLGTVLTFINQDSAGNVTIAITSDTMRLAGAGTTGSRTLTPNGMATAIKITTTEWIISGVNLL